MVKLRDQSDFSQESLAAKLSRDVGPQHLQGHIAVVLQIVREVDCRHPALAQFAVEAVAVAQGTGKLGTKVGCRSRLENGLQLMLLRGTPIASRGAGLVAPAG